MQLFLVTSDEYVIAHYITYQAHRELAKKAASRWLGGNPDKYIVSPLTGPDERFHIGISVNV